MATPSEVSLAHRYAALMLHASVDSRVHTEPARAKSPGLLPYWEARVDPDGVLDPTERLRRADCARRAHFTKLALKSAQSRSRNKAVNNNTTRTDTPSGTVTDASTTDRTRVQTSD